MSDVDEQAPGRPRWAVPLVIGMIVLGLAIGLGITGLKYAQLWMEGKVSEVALDLPAEHERGAQFGQGRPASECIEAGLQDALPCEKMDMFCQMRASLFTHGCLGTAEGSASFCDGVPAHDDEAASATWAAAECTARGHGDAPTCAPLLIQSWARYCTEGPAGPGSMSP